MSKLKSNFNEKSEDCKKLQEEIQKCMKNLSTYKVDKTKKKDSRLTVLLDNIDVDSDKENKKISEVATLEA